MVSTNHRQIVSDALMARIQERAPVYDRENLFFKEDFDELKAAGYLKLPVPKELGGPGLTLAEVAREQRAWPTTPPPRPWASTCTSTGYGSRLTSGTPETSRWSGCLKQP